MENLTQQILNYLATQEDKKSVREIATKTRIDADTVAKRLYMAHKRGDVIRTKRGKVYLYACANNQTADIEPVNDDVIIEVVPDSDITTDADIDDALKEVCHVDNLDKALEDLEQQIRTPRPVIENVDIKIKTLTKLAALLEDSISDVLIDVLEDIKQVSVS